MASQVRAPQQAIADSSVGGAAPGGSATDSGAGNDQQSFLILGELTQVLHEPKPDPAQARAVFGVLAPAHRALVMQNRDLMPKMVAALGGGGADSDSKAPEQTAEQGWGEWLGSSILEVVKRDPAYLLGEGIASMMSGGDEELGEAAGAAPAPATTAAAAPKAATPKGPEAPKAPAAAPKWTPRAAPAAAAGPIEGTDAISVDSLSAAEEYLPEYGADGELISGIGTYGFGQSGMIKDDDKRHWSEGAAADETHTWTKGGAPPKGKAGSPERAEWEAWNASQEQGMTQIWCSGLSTATLDDLGYPLDEAIPDQFYWEGGTQKSVTLRMVVEGMPEILAQTQEQDDFVTKATATFKEGLAQQYADAEALPDGKTKKDTIAALDDSVHKFTVETLFALEGNFSKGADGKYDGRASEDDPRVKGAAGAFEMDGIGVEIDDLTQVRPGDFCQKRKVGAAKGHAFQVHSVVAEADVLAGLPGSPEIIKPGTLDPNNGSMERKASVRITGTTNPNTILSAAATDWSVIESNVAGAIEEKSDPERDGGVAVRDDSEVPTKASTTLHFYVGRLAGSPWYGAKDQA